MIHTTRPNQGLTLTEVRSVSMRFDNGDVGRRFDDHSEDDVDSDTVYADEGSFATGLREGGMSAEETQSLGPSRRRSLASGDCCNDNLEEHLATTRRNSSLGVSLMTDYDNLGSAAAPSIHLGQVFMVNAAGEPTVPPYRPMVGAGAAAAYEALRDDFYVQKERARQQRRMSSLSFGSAKAHGGYRRKPVSQEECVSLCKPQPQQCPNQIANDLVRTFSFLQAI